MDAFHSEKARNMYQRLPRSDPKVVAQLEAEAEPDSGERAVYSQRFAPTRPNPNTVLVSVAETTKNFRELRKQLENDGWWDRDISHEVKLLSIWSSLGLSAVYFSHSELWGAGPLAVFLLGMFFTQSGWLGHDYVHGVDKWTDRFRQLTTAFAGLGVTWWSDKVRGVRGLRCVNVQR